jgi:hypothetical protein
VPSDGHLGLPVRGLTSLGDSEGASEELLKDVYNHIE